jgi:hypothetical protein|tara:strand:- start:963 stop:1235 length:273 start_codon:yes stop_codon:yes gene_type:complete
VHFFKPQGATASAIFATSLNLNKNRRFSKVSGTGLVARSDADDVSHARRLKKTDNTYMHRHPDVAAAGTFLQVNTMMSLSVTSYIVTNIK